jgi:hypothetical protein
MTLSRSRLAFAAALMLLVAGCRGADSTTAPESAPVAQLSFGSEELTVAVGFSRQLVLTIRDAEGHALTGRQVAWSSSNTAVVSVSQAGVAMPVAVGGPVLVTASSEGKSDTLAVFVVAQPGYYTGMPASIVVGQANFTSGQANRGGLPAANSFNFVGQAVVVGEKLVVADGQNNRVLVFNRIPTQNGASADVVIGQPDFTSILENQGRTVSSNTIDRATGVASDGQKLFVMDRDNHRVLIFNSVPTTNNAAADVVIGQPTMNERPYCGESALGNFVGVGANCLSSGPTGIAYDSVSRKLFVYDSDNDRVLIFNSVPTTNGAAASVVVGQPDMASNRTNQGGAPNARSLNLSTGAGIATHNGKFLVCDRSNNRVLIFNSIPTANNAAADVVVGQPNFTEVAANQGGAPGPRTLWDPRGVQVDVDGRMLIADGSNNRVLVFNQIPTQNNAAADVVLGQPNFTTNAFEPITASSQNFTLSMIFHRDLYILADNGNARILIFRIAR